MPSFKAALLTEKRLTFPILTFFALVALLGLGSLRVMAQTPYSLLTMSNEWRVNFNGTNLGSAWRLASYNDSNWVTSRGIFATISNDNTPLIVSQTNTTLPLTNGNNQFILTHYFRTRFTLTNDPYQVVLVMTNLIDDGAVFYLNGTEFRRYNMAAAPTPINYVSGASSSIFIVSYTTSTIPSNILVQGENVLAVELHNVSAASKDAVFGCAISVVDPPPTPITITNQPISQTVPEDATVTFSVGATGAPRAHQWYKNGKAIPGAAGTSLTIPNVQLQDGGEYWVTISNAVSLVESAHAALILIADTNGPTLLTADRISQTQIMMTFSEALSITSATNAANYVITNLGGGLLPVYSARLENATNVFITTAALASNTNYVVMVNQVTDASRHENPVGANNMAPVARWASLLDEYSFWHFYNPFTSQSPPAPWDENPDLGTSWRTPDYVVNAGTNDYWNNNELARGAFFYGSGALPADKGTELAASMAPIVYFRTSALLPGSSPAGLGLSIEHLSQDALICYLNGMESFRYNLPAGPVNWSTAATIGTGAEWRTVSNLEGSRLNPGENIICAELHSAWVPQTRMAYALRMKARISSLASGPVLITAQPVGQTVAENAPVTFSFMAAGPARFQWYMNGSPIPEATNAIYYVPLAPLSMNGAQISVHAWNENSSAISSNAFLTVIADTKPPILLGAYTISDDQILLNFSEWLDVVSATNVGNYVLTNGSGVDLPIYSAAISNGTNVLLTVGQGIGSKPYVVVLRNITDRTAAANTIEPNTAARVGLRLSIPIASVWKYNASGADLGTAWKDVAYDDSSWSQGAGLFYNENSPLPAPKNTLLPIASQVTGSNITTFYFRYPVSLPTATTNASVTLRHIIDDGVALYANGREFHRFNMPGGTISSTTYANVNPDNADYNGPFNHTLTNLTSGENVFAAELHQGTPTSGDICYGAEITISAPSLVIPPPVLPPPPTLVFTRTLSRLSWTGPGFTLQRTSNLQGTNTVWQNITGSSPYTIPPGQGAAFYRLKSN